MKTLGIILIGIGILFFVYKGFSYVTRERVAKLGPLEITADKEKTVWFPPLMAAVLLGTGIVLLVMSPKHSS